MGWVGRKIHEDFVAAVVVVVVFFYVRFMALIFLSFYKNSCREVFWKKVVLKISEINSKQIGV